MKAVLRKFFNRSTPGSVTLRPVQPEDLPALCAIVEESSEAAHWTPADFLVYRCEVALLGGRVAGFIVWRETYEDEREILNLAVRLRFRRLGVARALLQFVIRSSPGEIFLEVRESNKAARNLYESAGFQETGMRPGYYENPLESAIVMRILS